MSKWNCFGIIHLPFCETIEADTIYEANRKFKELAIEKEKISPEWFEIEEITEAKEEP